MISKFLRRFFGTKNDRELKKMQPILNYINLLENRMKKMKDEELRNQINLFKSRYNNGETVDELLPEAFATVREASRRILSMRHYDVQILGGIVLHSGKIAEMKTGEGKTLVATLPAYLNCISGQGVHIITVNDYLASRDSSWMKKLYKFLGVTVGNLKQDINNVERKIAYNANITYGTNNEFGFDYLRDNMKFNLNDIVQNKLYFAIIDEVDSILIDEARTPLIISGSSEESTDLYNKSNKIVKKLNFQDYELDEKTRSVILTSSGVSKIESDFKIENIYSSKHMEKLHHIIQSLKAHTLFKVDVDYIIKSNEVIIVDEFTGRLMPGRRYGEGLHQALEAKEKVNIKNENQTFATITFQNYFRMYNKLSGMTGTADTEASEFKKIYNLDVIVIPTNMPMIRKDFSDIVYKKRNNKINAIIKEVKNLNKKQQPILVGTSSINSSEELSKKLKKYKIIHSILNAKNHKKEAEIIAQAGQKGSVTISTNMAGRGTDIVLGKGVVDIGGLHIIGTERHESRRIDNQLRGRSGRQGDPGSSRFYLALEDDLLRVFGGEKISSVMDRLGLNDEDAMEHNLITKSIESAQFKVESHNFNIRKHLLEYDDVLNQQRKIIYKQRRDLLLKKNLKLVIKNIIYNKSTTIVSNFFSESEKSNSNYDLNKIQNLIFQEFNFEIQEFKKESPNLLNYKDTLKMVHSIIYDFYLKKETMLGQQTLRELECNIMLHLVDNFWKQHLLNMEYLKEGIGLRGYAQQDPLIIYKKEGFNMFQDMISTIRSETVKILFRIDLKDLNISHINKLQNEDKILFHGANNKEENCKKKIKIGRNSLCPCGSNKKYKKCCGQ